MQFKTTKQELFPPLKMVTGVVEQRQVLPILGNILVQLISNTLHLTATDNEIEITCQSQLATIGNVDGEATLPAKKLFDIVRTLDTQIDLSVVLEGDVATLKAGKSKFKLKTLPADDFPKSPGIEEKGKFVVSQRELKNLMSKVAYATAVNDIRYYLNGILLEISDGKISIVGTDGHRMAVAQHDFESEQNTKVIIPRKTVLELSKLLIDNEKSSVEVLFDDNHIQFKLSDSLVVTSKLIDGDFPDWRAVVPVVSEVIHVEKITLNLALQRAIILAHEKYKGVALRFDENQMVISTHTQNEESENIISAEYTGDNLEIGFNGVYILEAINTIDSPKIQLGIVDNKSSLMISDTVDSRFFSIVMPMRL